MKKEHIKTEKISRSTTCPAGKENIDKDDVSFHFTTGRTGTHKEKKYQNRDWQDENE